MGFPYWSLTDHTFLFEMAYFFLSVISCPYGGRPFLERFWVSGVRARGRERSWFGWELIWSFLTAFWGCILGDVLLCCWNSIRLLFRLSRGFLVVQLCADVQLKDSSTDFWMLKEGLPLVDGVRRGCNMRDGWVGREKWLWVGRTRMFYGFLRLVQARP